MAVPLLAVVAACSTESPEPTTTFRPTATIRDIMLTMIDPSADVIWESVATIVSYDGVEDRRPRTDEEWERVRDDAIELVEATNLLLMEGRAVAAPGIRSENPGLELEPEEIQVLIEEDRATWNRMVGDLYTVSLIMLNAVNVNLVAFAVFLHPDLLVGVIFAIFIITVAAAEVALALAIVLRLYRSRSSVNVDEVNLMKW